MQKENDVPSEKRFQRLEDRMIDVKEQQAIMITKFDINSENMQKMINEQRKLNEAHGERLGSLEKIKARVVGFSAGVATVSGAGFSYLWNILTGGAAPPHG